MLELCKNITWTSSDESVATVRNGSYIRDIYPHTYTTAEGSYSLLWAHGVVTVGALKEGTATITGALSDGTAVSCEVTVEKEKESGSDAGSGGSLVIGDDASGQVEEKERSAHSSRTTGRSSP